jgi:hypothetical protein
MKCVPDAQRGAHVLVAVQEECRHLHMGSTSRRSAVHARAIARNPAGWNSVSEAANSSTLSLVAAVENIVGSIVAMNSVGGSCDARRLCSSRCSASVEGSDPAHPAYALARTKLNTVVGWRR